MPDENVNSRRFTEFFDSYFHIPIKFGTNPSTIFLVIVVTYRHTDTHTQTNAGENISINQSISLHFRQPEPIVTRPIHTKNTNTAQYSGIRRSPVIIILICRPRCLE